jgi:hypothetical protein
MTGVALLWHQLRYDARRARALVLATWALMALAAWNAWPTITRPIWPTIAVNLYAAALVLVAVLIVLAAAPARPDSFHGGKPVAPGVRLGSTLLLAFGGLLGAAAVLTVVQLAVYGVPLRAVPAVLAMPMGTMAAWMLAGVALASHGRTIATVLGQGVALLVGLLLMDLALPAWMDELALPQQPWLLLQLLLAALLLLTTWRGFQRRWASGLGMGVGTGGAGMAALALFYVATHGPATPDPWRTLPTVPGVGLVIEGVQVDPAQRSAVIALSDLGAAEEDEVRAPLVLQLRVTGAPAGAQLWSDSLQLSLTWADGRSTLVSLTDERELYRSAVQAAEGRTWRGTSPRVRLTARVPVFLHDSVRTQLAAAGPGAQLVRVALAGRVKVLRQRPLATLAYGGAATWRAPGLRLVTTLSRDSLGPRLELASRELADWREQAGLGQGFDGQVNSYALNAAGTEAVRLRQEQSAMHRGLGILPGAEGQLRRYGFRPDRASGLPADDPWFAGAQLLLLAWERVGTAVVASTHAIPPG